MKQDLSVLYQVCAFSGGSENQDGRPDLLLTETFSTFSMKPLNGIQRYVSLQDLNVLPSLCFPGRSDNQECPP